MYNSDRLESLFLQSLISLSLYFLDYLDHSLSTSPITIAHTLLHDASTRKIYHYPTPWTQLNVLLCLAFCLFVLSISPFFGLSQSEYVRSVFLCIELTKITDAVLEYCPPTTLAHLIVTSHCKSIRTPYVVPFPRLSLYIDTRIVQTGEFPWFPLVSWYSIEPLPIAIVNWLDGANSAREVFMSSYHSCSAKVLSVHCRWIKHIKWQIKHFSVETISCTE